MRTRCVCWQRFGLLPKAGSLREKRAAMTVGERCLVCSGWDGLEAAQLRLLWCASEMHGA